LEKKRVIDFANIQEESTGQKAVTFFFL